MGVSNLGDLYPRNPRFCIFGVPLWLLDHAFVPGCFLVPKFTLDLQSTSEPPAPCLARSTAAQRLASGQRATVWI